MKQYTGEEFVELLRGRGASDSMQRILDKVESDVPTDEQIESAETRKSVVARRHFVNAKNHGGEELYVQVEIAYWKTKRTRALRRKVLTVSVYDDVDQYDLYREMARREAPTFQSN